MLKLGHIIYSNCFPVHAGIVTKRIPFPFKIVEVAKLMADAGIIVFVALISPHREDREFARDLFGKDDFLEIYVKCSLATCEERDSKGNFKKARAGITPNFVGISIPYEAPEAPDLLLDTDQLTVDEASRRVIELLGQRGFLDTSSTLLAESAS